LLVDFDEEELMDELKGAVHYGDGLVYVKTKADDEHDLSELFGVQFKGMSTNKDMEVSFVQSELGGTMTLRSSGKAVKTALTSSAAKGLGTVKDKKESYPVVVSSQYGRGKTVLFAFDLLASSDQGTVSSLLTNALGFVAPSEPQVRALGEVPLLITLQNSAEPADVQVTETVPSDTGVESIVPDAAQTGSGMEWSSALSGNQDMSFEYSLVLPDRAGSYRTETEVRYGNGGEYRLYGQYALDISVTQGSTELLEEVLTALQGLVLSSKKDTERVNEALEELGDVEREASGRKEAEKNIGRITEALKELSEVSADVDSVRTKLEELLKVWQGKWSALPEEGKKDKEEKDKEKGKEHSSLLKGRKSVLVASLGSLSGLLDATPAEEAMYFYHTDHLGTPILMTDERGEKVWEAEFMPFGEAYSITGTVGNNFRFPEQYYDEETGLHQNGNREYKAEVGRYIEGDPIGFAGGDVNLYQYVRANPVNFIDPDGLNPIINFLIRNADKIIPLADKAFNVLKNPPGPPKVGETIKNAEKLWDKYQEAVDRNRGYMGEKRAVQGCHSGK
ncbi:MAG: RHS repeat-associated core domain-containing protein, partial [Terriglobia bacterium]